MLVLYPQRCCLFKRSWQIITGKPEPGGSTVRSFSIRMMFLTVTLSQLDRKVGFPHPLSTLWFLEQQRTERLLKKTVVDRRGTNIACGNSAAGSRLAGSGKCR